MSAPDVTSTRTQATVRFFLNCHFIRSCFHFLKAEWHNKSEWVVWRQTQAGRNRESSKSDSTPPPPSSLQWNPQPYFSLSLNISIRTECIVDSSSHQPFLLLIVFMYSYLFISSMIATLSVLAMLLSILKPEVIKVQTGESWLGEEFASLWGTSKDHMVGLVVDGRVILKLISKK